MRILVAESKDFSARAVDILERIGEVTLADLDQHGLEAGIGDADVVFVRLRNRIDDAVLGAHPGLQAVVSPTTGLDHVDLAAADAQGTAVLSLRGETDFLETVTATAEHTWALLLALVRRIPAATQAGRRGDWDRDRYRGRELAGKTLGILGLGRLGRMVARYGDAFGMHVLAYDPYRDPWPDGVTRAPSLTVLADRSDVLSVHVPLNDETRGMVDAKVLGRLERTSVLINTSRGGIVDEAALLDALASGALAGAAVDVVDGETGPGGAAASPVVAYAAHHPELLVTPHVGGATLESMENTEIFMARKLASWCRGVPVRVDAGPERYRPSIPRFEP
ncbi:MAG: NAD(P)-dependent oxidoreductase [Longimicrobiales bacterium]